MDQSKKIDDNVVESQPFQISWVLSGWIVWKFAYVWGRNMKLMTQKQSKANLNRCQAFEM